MDTSTPIVRQFDYRPPKLQVVALFLLALAGTFLLAYFAIYLEGPVDVRGLRLSQFQARVMCRVVASISPVGLFLLGAMVYVAFAYNRRIALTTTHLILPKPTRMGLSRDEIQIPLDAIASATVLPFLGSTLTLRLQYSEGRVVNIPSNMFHSGAVFDDLCQSIQRLVNPDARKL